MANPYDTGLDKNPANYQPLTPLVFLERAAAVHPAHTAIIHGKERIAYGDFYVRTRKLASSLASRGIGEGDTVSVMLANTPAMLEAHYGVPMTGAVLHSINTRLDAPAVAFMLDHAKTKVLIGDTEFGGVLKEALSQTKAKPLQGDTEPITVSVNARASARPTGVRRTTWIGSAMVIAQRRRSRGSRAPGGWICSVPTMATGTIGHPCASARRAAPV